MTGSGCKEAVVRSEPLEHQLLVGHRVRLLNAMVGSEPHEGHLASSERQRSFTGLAQSGSIERHGS
jgi:hypothetical protein